MQTSTYPPERLLDLWSRGELTTEQAIGHILQHLLDHDKRLAAYERQSPTTTSQQE